MKQVRNTNAKTEILKLIEESEKAWSHADIQDKLGTLCNRVTIYRVLERLEEEGKVHKIVNVDGIVNYAKCKHCQSDHHDHQHIHFNCESCHSVICIENAVPEIELPKGYVSRSYNFVISGLCPNCSANSN
ncbi:HTH domain-containing protein [Chryseobacterium sp. NEB161]|jgi:Fur family ferric uptake transcriptional regulator|nr:HTH domain-containing protein [Chryseobacterium sp. NEB161]